MPHYNLGKTPSRVIGVQFSILSPEEIRNQSVAEITTKETYISNKPVVGGLFDPRMGVLEPGIVCPTDGLDYMKTPGYFGHIELATPVFYIQYLSIILKILKCVCFKCGTILLNTEKYKHLLELSAKARWDEVYAIASKNKRCGDDNENGCGCKQPDRIKKDGLATIIAEWSSIGDDAEKTSVILTPEIIIKIFRRITDENIKFLGFSPLWSRPEWMICQVLAVPPPAMRPSVKHDAQQRSEDDITHIIINIIKTNKSLAEKIEQNANDNIINDWTLTLQYYIATMINNKIPGVSNLMQRSGRPLKSITERLNGKTGRVRGNLMGKRVDF
jgi:DNA-directed RNA polymerase II subunit RPB1